MMPPMVQQQQQESSQQRQQVTINEVEQEEASTTETQNRSRKPLIRRLINYVREAWTGVKFALGVDAGDSDSFAREGYDGLLMTFKRFSFTVDTQRGVDTELEIGRRLDGELDATDGELNPEVLFEGLAQEVMVWPKFIVE
ncbi:hypothetical protein FQA39_LY13124 [Lamprigera yunnana]|nr:hypothetical protein FQA39_LY13124 [Lamprigera yunnana]